VLLNRYHVSVRVPPTSDSATLSAVLNAAAALTAFIGFLCTLFFSRGWSSSGIIVIKTTVSGLAVSTILTAVAAVFVARGADWLHSPEVAIILIAILVTSICGACVSVFTVTRG
jgi:hypothetical protein